MCPVIGPPAFIQTTRALMIIGSLLGLPAVGMLLMSMPCISLGNEAQSSKNKCAILGGVLMLVVGKRQVHCCPLLKDKDVCVDVSVSK